MVLGLLIDIMEVTEHFDGGDVCSCIIDDAFTSVFDNILKELKCLIYLPPLAGFFLQEATVDAWHDLVEVLTEAGWVSYETTAEEAYTNKLNVLDWGRWAH